MNPRTTAVGLCLVGLMAACQTSPSRARVAEPLSHAVAQSSQQSASSWGEGTQHVGASFTYNNTDFDTTPSVDVDTLELRGEYGYLLDENWEILGVFDFMNIDAGAGADTTNWAAMLGGRYYVSTPNQNNQTAVYGEGRAGIANVEFGPVNENEFVWALAGGVIWWPWGVASGMAFDLSVDYQSSDSLDRLGAFLGMGFWF